MPELILSLAEHQEVVQLGPHEAIGRGPTNTIVVDHPSIEGDHAFLERRDGKTWLFDLGSSRGTYVGRERNRGEGMALVDGDEIQWGDVRGSYREDLADWGAVFVSDEAAERALAAAVRAAPDDEGPRHVLGDWLEARGEIERAAYMRRPPSAFGRGEPVTGIDQAFAAVFDRSPIEGCSRGPACPAARWDRLRAAGGVRRRCDHCHLEVAYCTSQEERERHRLSRRLVVVGAMASRATRTPYRPAAGPAWDHAGASLIVVAEGARSLLPLARDVVLGTAASRTQLGVFERDGRHWIEELRSTGGIYVGGAQLRGPTMLHHGDEVFAAASGRFVYRASARARVSSR